MATIKTLTFPKLGLEMPRVNAALDLENNPAKWAHERLVRSIARFEEALDDDKEIGARLVSFTEHETFHIEDVGYWGPDFVTFYGTNLDGNPVELIQHLSQISVLLIALPKESDEPRRIGFAMEERLEQDAKKEAEDEGGGDHQGSEEN